jgi:glycosyltransferase involved in cell wall biosynthesis
MRVLLVNDLSPGDGGGAEVHLGRLITGLEEAGDAVEVFAGEVRHTGANKVLDLWDPFARATLAGRAARFRPDVVHHHNIWRELSGSVLGVPSGVPCILTCHDHRLLGLADGAGMGMRGIKARLDRILARRRVDVAVGVSGALVESLRAAGFRDVEHVPGFAVAPPSSALGPVEASRDVVFAGRLVPEKGVRVLAGAFEIVAGRFPDARLVVVGEGPDRAVLERLGARVGPEQVVLHGRLGDAGVLAAMSRALAVVVPSTGPEGSPTVAIEAALAGRPLVVSDDPGLRELVDQGECGIVVPAGSAEALADALSQLLADPARAARLGSAGRQLALRRHSVEAGVARLRAIYAGGRGLPPP